MLIDTGILIKSGGIARRFRKNEEIFHENGIPEHYYQIESGLVRLSNFNEKGKEFIQGIFRPGECFGEPPLFLDEHYFASAYAMTDAVIYMLPKDIFFNLLKRNRSVETIFLKNFARRVYNRSLASRDIISNEPAQRISGFLNMYTRERSQPGERQLIPFTRQEIANFTGLRVETVIRTLIKMKEENKVEIIERKLYY